MKIDTYKKILLGVYVAVLVAVFNQDKWLPLIFPSAQGVIIRTSVLSVWIALLSFPAIMLFLQKFFVLNSHKEFTRMGKVFFTGLLIAVIVVPLSFIGSRTEISGSKVTQHNIFGGVSKVYKFEDAKKVETGLTVGGGQRSLSARMSFGYEVSFEDGYTVFFDQYDIDENWAIIKQIDGVVISKNIEKEIYGQGLIDNIYEYSGVDFVGYKAKELMGCE